VTTGKKISRRELLGLPAKAVAAAAAGALLAGCEERPKTHSFRLGLDTYTLHRSLTAKDPKNRRDLWGVLDQLDDLGLEGIQIDPSHFPGDDEKTLERLKSLVKPRGHYIEFGMGGWDMKRMEARIRLTAQFGGRALRTFCGSERNSQEELQNFIRWATPAFREAGKIAGAHGVHVAVENHGDFTSAQLKELLARVGHPRVGACLDTGNSLFRGEDPMECARTLAPYALSMHLKDWTMTRQQDGTPRWKEAVPGKGQIPVLEILRLVARYKSDLFIALESPVQPSEDEAETVAREWRHLVASARAAREMLKAL